MNRKAQCTDPLRPQSQFHLPSAVLVGAFLLAVFWPAAAVEAQMVSPASISIDPSNACGGGTDVVNDVCVTLPDTATCGTVDVFLLFDDTSSFLTSIMATRSAFDDIVSDLTSNFPGVDFAFGVGRFEEFGGPGRDFNTAPPGSPLERPFILNQALLKSNATGFATSLQAALSPTGSGPGGGGDIPESAVEALFQVATGAGFNGNPSAGSSSLDSGPAGNPTAWQSPGTSGDVPTFASYVGTKSGTLGGAGWRTHSCLRLVLLATDACTVAPFASDPASITISGTNSSSVPASAFHCTSGNRYGLVGTAETLAASQPNAVAPVGAATVPQAVQALNDLGIQVIGLGPGATPTSSTAPTSNESTFLSALARLTGAVDATGTPLVFDFQNDAAAIRSTLVDVVSDAVTAPIDVMLKPDPDLPGLTVTPTPAVHEDIEPGEQACFSVEFAGDASFEGGSFGLDFVNPASDGTLGMRIPVNMRCPDCFDLTPSRLLCNVGADGGTSSFEWTFVLRNRSKENIEHLFFVDLPPDVTITPQHVTFPIAIRPNHSRAVTVTINGAFPGTTLDFRITLHDAEIDQCCAEEVEIELPTCDCAQLRTDRAPSCFSFPFHSTTGPPWRYTFELENLTAVPVDYLLLAPVSSADMSTPLPSDQLVIDSNVIKLPSTLGLGDESGSIAVDLSGPAAKRGEPACFRISTHDALFAQCCSIVKCVRIPNCTFSVDTRPLGGATLTRTAETLLLLDIGASGDDGLAADFPAAREVEMAIQDFSTGLSLPAGTFLRLEARGSDEGKAASAGSLVAELQGDGSVRISAGDGSSQVTEVLLLRDGEIVASSQTPVSVLASNGQWPTRFVATAPTAATNNSNVRQRTRDLITSNSVAGYWSEAVALRLEGGGEVLANQVLFHFAGSSAREGVNALDLEAAYIPSISFKYILPRDFPDVTF